MLQKIFPKLFGIGKKDAQSASLERFWRSIVSQDIQGYPYVSDEAALKFYRTNSAVATSTDIIGEAVESIPPVIDTGKELVDDHEVLDLLKKPNPFETYKNFIGKLSRFYSLVHDYYVLAEGNFRRMPTGIYAPMPQNVTIQTSLNEFPSTYRVGTGMLPGTYSLELIERTARYLDGRMKEIFHIKGFSSQQNYKGDSPLLAVALEIQQMIEGRFHNKGLLSNGGRPSMAVNFSGLDLGTNNARTVVPMEELRKRAQFFREQVGGSRNAGSIIATTGSDTKITELGKTNKDMDFATLDRMASEAVYRRYKIPLPIIYSDASTFNNTLNGYVFLYEHTVLPHLDLLFSGLTRFLRIRTGRDDFRITYNMDQIGPLISKKLQELKLRKEINIETVNELRAGLPNRRDIEAGDFIYQPGNLVPMGEQVSTEDDFNMDRTIGGEEENEE